MGAKTSQASLPPLQADLQSILHLARACQAGLGRADRRQMGRRGFSPWDPQDGSLGLPHLGDYRREEAAGREAGQTWDMKALGGAFHLNTNRS